MHRYYGFQPTSPQDITLNETEAQAVRMIFSEYLTGSSLGQIAESLQTHSFPSPAGKEIWSRSSVDNLLTKGYYVPAIIAFLFWSIAVGIVLAAGMIPLAVFGSIVIGVMLIVFVNKKSHDNPYIVVVHCIDEEAEGQAFAALKDYVQKCVVKSKTVTADAIELHYEVRLKSEDTSFVNTLSKAPGVSNVVLVSYNGDYMG